MPFHQSVLHVHHITSLDQPELAPYRSLRQLKDEAGRDIFVAEGAKIVQRLLETGLPIASLALTEEWLKEFRPKLETRPETIHAYVGTKELLDTLAGYPLYQSARAVAYSPAPLSLAAVLANSPTPRLFVAVDGLNNSENLGTLIRNGVALGAQALIVGETASTPYLARTVRCSMGTIFQLPVVKSDNLAATLQQLRQHGVLCYGAHPHTQQRLLSAANLKGNCCLVFGHEDEGISPAVRAACDELVVVPMQQGVDSLNVANAAAIFLYEVNRQRGLA